MNEEKKDNKSTEDLNDGDKPEVVDPIAEANAASERLEKATHKAEQVQARAIIGGKSVGKIAEPEKKEVDAIEYSKKALRNDI